MLYTMYTWPLLRHSIDPIANNTGRKFGSNLFVHVHVHVAAKSNACMVLLCAIAMHVSFSFVVFACGL